MSCLSIIQNAASRLGLRQPQTVVGSTDLNAQILLSLANQEGEELSRYHDWQNLIVQQAYTSLAQVVQTNALPSNDYDRLIYNPEIWDRTRNLRFTGPTPQRYWVQLQQGVSGGVIGFWRIIGNELNIFPAPPAGDTLDFEYISKRWAVSAGGDFQEAFLADTDTARIPERLITLGVIWRFRQSRGFPQYAEDMSTYEREREKAASRDRSTGAVRPDSMRGQNWPPYPVWTGTLEN